MRSEGVVSCDRLYEPEPHNYYFLRGRHRSNGCELTTQVHKKGAAFGNAGDDTALRARSCESWTRDRVGTPTISGSNTNDGRDDTWK